MNGKLRWAVISNSPESVWGRMRECWCFKTRAEAREFVLRTNKEAKNYRYDETVSGPYDLGGRKNGRSR